MVKPCLQQKEEAQIMAQLFFLQAFFLPTPWQIVGRFPIYWQLGAQTI
jgi:hypothetical protein